MTDDTVELTEHWYFNNTGGAVCKRFIDGVFLDERTFEQSPIALVRETFCLSKLEAQRIVDEAKKTP